MRMALFGGSFNPIHVGHLAIAEAAREACRLDRVLFMPAGSPPHKKSRGLAPARDRLAMVKAAIRGNPAFAVSDMEIRRTGPSFTVDTLVELRAKLPKTGKLFIILGMDSVAELRSWREPGRILTLASLIVAARPGVDSGAIRRLAPLRHHCAPPLVIPELVAVSATQIRERLAHGESARYLVPDPVLREIGRRGLYRAR